MNPDHGRDCCCEECLDALEALYDADELGLDPEEDDDRAYAPLP